MFYFPLVSGIVTEFGGLISYGAVVAREYGLLGLVGLFGSSKKKPKHQTMADLSQEYQPICPRRMKFTDAFKRFTRKDTPHIYAAI
ncbi:putative phosphotransferase yvkC-like [Tropilaelaps mercedesae]|uniref:Putative phosphotransferase yvkC-like n=1 Tax=Tropilaelaps mercedesae TaxID=418985 RepID=A0A1V9XU74_9ACAR|nr:putative phosphotransferase yvkC-like [Tropilaelaps mercedesae]